MLPESRTNWSKQATSGTMSGFPRQSRAAAASIMLSQGVETCRGAQVFTVPGRTATDTCREQKGFNSRAAAIKYFNEHSNGRPHRFVPQGEDSFAPAHLWEEQLERGEDPRMPKKQWPKVAAATMHTGSNDMAPIADASVPPTISVEKAATKWPRDNGDDESWEGHGSMAGKATDASGMTLRAATEATPTLRVSYLPRGVTHKVLHDAFFGYGDLTDIIFECSDEAVVRYTATDAAVRMLAANNGRTVADHIRAVDYVYMFQNPAETAPMNNDATTGGSTISTKAGMLWGLAGRDPMNIARPEAGVATDRADDEEIVGATKRNHTDLANPCSNRATAGRSGQMQNKR